MGKSNFISKVLENSDGELSWDGRHVKVLGGTKLQIGDEECDFNSNIQQAVSKRSLVLIRTSTDAIWTFNVILRTVDFKNYKTRVGATKRGRF